MANLPTADQVYLALLDDSVPKIAREAGVPWEAIWNHPKNAELRATRHPQVLRKGDPVFVPAPEQKQVNVAVGNYPGSVTLAANIIVRGGFDATTWLPAASGATALIGSFNGAEGQFLTVLAKNCGTSVRIIEKTYAKVLRAKEQEFVERGAPSLRR